MKPEKTKSNGAPDAPKPAESDPEAALIEAKATIAAERDQREKSCLAAVLEQCKIFRCNLGSEPYLSNGITTSRVVITAKG